MWARHLSRRDLLDVLELIHGSVGCTNGEGMRSLLRGVKALIQDGGAIAALSSSCGPGEDPLAALRIVSTDYPEDYIRVLQETGLASHDPILCENFRAFGLQQWANTLARTGFSPEMRKIVSLAADYGFSHHAQGWGYAYGMRDAGGVGSFFCFAGLPRSERTAEILRLLGPHLHVALLRVPREWAVPQPLTSREVEVLRWVGQGKSNWEVSQILSISERTAKFHVENAIRKLHASTRAHAVAKALEHRIIAVD